MVKFVAVLCGCFTASYPRALLLSFTSAPGLLLNAVFAAIVLFILTLVSKRNNDLFGTKTEDERGVAISTEGTYGTSEWMDKEEAKQVYEVCPVEEAGGTILGQFTQDGEEIVALPYKKRANRNLILIGPPGSGKSFGYVRTAIFQSVKREESIVITDPKGEIHNDMRKFLEAHGYVVKVFNLKPQKERRWTVCGNHDPRTGDIDEQRVVVFCETIMRNTSAGDDDEFWGSGEKNLFKVAVLYTAFMREQALQRLYERHAKELLGKLPYVEEEDQKRICSLMEDKETEMVD
ncbi:MAG: type IV secretory system conjugative DNA transfer family protein, partial [Merdibacter sp.]